MDDDVGEDGGTLSAGMEACSVQGDGGAGDSTASGAACDAQQGTARVRRRGKQGKQASCAARQRAAQRSEAEADGSEPRV